MQESTTASAAPPDDGGMPDSTVSGLCYLMLIVPVLALYIALLALFSRPYTLRRVVRFNALQTIFLMLAFVVLMIVLMIVNIVLTTIGTALAFTSTNASIATVGLVFLINAAVFVGLLIGWVILVVRTFRGRWVVIPIVGALARRAA